MNPIHKKALEVAARFKQAEADLISVLQEVEAQCVFVNLGYHEHVQLLRPSAWAVGEC